MFHGTEFRVVFSTEEWFGTEFRELASIFVSRNVILSIFLFRGSSVKGFRSSRKDVAAQKEDVTAQVEDVPSLEQGAKLSWRMWQLSKILY